ncbi:MAG: hypothetical protein KDD94_07095 [Calditrichaeota bacterium]|nr:hypothetical protein [Calditrichota bacterium]
MKFIIIILLISLNYCASNSENPVDDTPVSLDDYEWTELNFPQAGFKHDDIYFINPDTGWVTVNDQPRPAASPPYSGLFKTTDGGLTWQKGILPTKPTGGREFFRCIGFLNGQIGFAGNLFGADGDTEYNQLYKTSDGGLSWQIVPIDSNVVGLCGISTVSPSTVYLAGRFLGPAYLVKSTDSGNNWTVINLEMKLGRVVDVKFLDANHGFIVGGSHSSHAQTKAVIYETTDGGLNWIKRYEGPREGEWCWKIQFLNNNVVYASIETDESVTGNSEGDAFLKSTDGGKTWERITFYSEHYSSQGIGFISEKIGWMGSFDRHSNLSTIDGGKTWQSFPYSQHLNRFRFFSDTLGYVAGARLYKIRKIK